MTIESTLERIAAALERMSGLTAVADPPPGVGGYTPQQAEAPGVGGYTPQQAEAPAGVQRVATAVMPNEQPKRRGRPPKTLEDVKPDGVIDAPPPQPEQEVTVEMVRSALVEFGNLTSTEEGFKIMQTHSGARKISEIAPERRAAVLAATRDAIRKVKASA